MTKHVLALDQGTTSSRAIVFGRDGRAAASAQKEFPQILPAPGHVEHEPEAIWQSQLETARQALAKARLGAGDIAAIGVTNQRETTILWERATGKPVANAFVWQSRAADAREPVGVVRPLVGRWTTTDPAYAGRYIEITPEEIAFGQGAEGEARHRIVGVWRVGRDSRAIFYSIRYAAEDGEVEVGVRSSPRQLRLMNLPKVVWRRAS